MSYDLYFTRPQISQDQFVSYFNGRPNYEVSGQQSVYQNEDTGVYFIFDYTEPDDSDPEDIESTASFNLNFYRPSVFGLEAVDEVSAFVKNFGFSVFDPQNDGMGEGPYSPEAFLRGWNIGNEFGYSAVLRGEGAPEKVWTLPTTTIEDIWRWNRAKIQTQSLFGEDRFVPRIICMSIGGAVRSVAVWPDAISELIPEVDYLFIVRDELAPKPLFGSKKKDQILLPIEQARDVLRLYKTSDYSMPAYSLPAPQVPGSLRKFVSSLKATGITGDGISADQVLNAEIIQKFRG